MSTPLAPRYPLTRGDQIAFVNKLQEWMNILGLNDWHCLSVEMVDDADFLAEATVFTDLHSFRVRCRTHWDIPVCEQNTDYIAVHELMHVVLGPLWKFAFDLCPPSQNELLNRIEHEAIARLCRAVAHPTKVIRGIEGIEEVVPGTGTVLQFQQVDPRQELAACERYYEQQGERHGMRELASDMQRRWAEVAREAMQEGRDPVHGDETGEAAKRWWQVSARDSNWLNGFTREGQMIEAFCAGAEWARQHMVAAGDMETPKNGVPAKD